jgi:hypothetical protein
VKPVVIKPIDGCLVESPPGALAFKRFKIPSSFYIHKAVTSGQARGAKAQVLRGVPEKDDPKQIQALAISDPFQLEDTDDSEANEENFETYLTLSFITGEFSRKTGLFVTRDFVLGIRAGEQARFCVAVVGWEA